MKMRHPNPNMLLRIAQGDSYAMAAEYVKRHPEEPEYQELRDIKRYLSHPTYHKLPPGTYTDDTQMSIAVTEALLDSKDAREVSHERFVQYWFDAFKRDERDGYSRGFQALLEQAKTADELRALLQPTSTKNGAAMRSVPLGVIADPEWVKTIAMRQAGTTHATYEGVTSSVAVALMSHYALYDRRDFLSMPRWLSNHLPIFEKFQQPWEGPVQSKCKHSPYDVGINTAWAVHTLLLTQQSLRDIMVQVLDWGGDTDSVAAIAWGIASCRYPNEQLPSFLEDDLEKINGSAYGPAFLKDLGKRLMDAYA